VFAFNPTKGSNRGNGPSFSVQYFALVYMAMHPGVDFLIDFGDHVVPQSCALRKLLNN